MVSATRWAITGYEQEWDFTTLRIILTTDRTCHLWLQWTEVDPKMHLHQKLDRGLFVMEDPKYCFVQFTGIEQLEDGDTTVHTFNFPGWYHCLTRWWIFVGTIGGIPSPSNTAIFTEHREVPPMTVGIIAPDPQDELVFDTIGHSIIEGRARVRDGLYMVAYHRFQDPDPGIYIATMTIDDMGMINLVDKRLMTPSTYGTAGTFAHVEGNIWALSLCNHDPGPGSQVITFTVSPDGVIGFVIDALILSPPPGYLNLSTWLLHDDGPFFLCAFMNNAAILRVASIVIYEDGQIADPPRSLLDIESNVWVRFLAHRYGNRWILTHERFPSGSKIVTFHATTTDPFMFIVDQTNIAPGSVYRSQIYRYAGNHHAIFYAGSGQHGWAAIFDITKIGDITPEYPTPPKDTYEWDPVWAIWPYAIPISRNYAGTGHVFTITSGGQGSALKLRTVLAYNNATFLKDLVDEQFIDTRGARPTIIHVWGHVYAIFYTDRNLNAKVQTRVISTYPA